MASLSNKLYHFRKGQKEIYLPNFTITLIRSPALPPIYAKFQVPLSFTKLDLRDYLFHAYGVRVLKVRSFVDQQPVRQNDRGQKYRPRAEKRMTVEMDRPFVWPEEPEGDVWDRETFTAAQDDRQAAGFEQSATPLEKGRKKPKKVERETIAAQAKALLSGKEKWRPTWEDLGAQGAPKTLDVVHKEWVPKKEDVEDGPGRGV